MGVASVGAPAAIGLLVLSEAALPVPFPSDLLMLLVGERAAAGAVPVWVAVAGLEVATIVGTTVLFLASRSVASGVVRRFGPRVGLTPSRIARAAATVERRGRGAVAIGRGTPGFRTVTVLAASASGLRAGAALPPLVLGATVFVQGHFVLGYLVGRPAVDALDSALPVVVGVVALLVVGLVVWRRVQRRHTAATGAWLEAACPACLVLGALARTSAGDPEPVRA